MVSPGLFQSAPAPLPEGVEQFLNTVVTNYGRFSGVALSNLTHRPGTPWQLMYRDGELNKQIPNDVIQSHYQQLLRERT